MDVFPIWETDGKISKFIHISRDITQRLKEEEEITRRLEEMVEERTRQLRETHSKLLHQDKMASLGKLAAAVVHEINNPIAGILNLNMLIKRIINEGPLEQKEINKFGDYLDLMEKETRRISQIVTNLLSFSRHNQMALERLSVNRLIDKTLILNANLLKLHQIRVEKKFDPKVPDIIGSEDQLQQVFMNLISNAVEAMESKAEGVLSIETRLASSEQRIVVKFSDNGIGIPKKNFSRLFEPFFSTKKDGKGVGLGLSVAYGIIKEHGGYIYVESDLGKGTIFRVNLALRPVTHMNENYGGSDGQHQNSNR